MHIWSPLRIKVYDVNCQQTWPPLLLKIENLTKNSEKSSKATIATKLWVKDTFMIPFKNYGWWPQLISNMAATVTKNRKFNKKFNKKMLKNPVKGNWYQILGEWCIYDPI